MKLTKFFLFYMVIALFNCSANAATHEKIIEKKDDVVIITKIKARLALDRLVKSLNIKVESKNGELTLRGTVDSNQKLERILVIANSIAGVNDLRTDQLLVRNTPEQRRDIMIQAMIKGNLIKNQICSPNEIYSNQIEVQSIHGNVNLLGKVRSHHAQSEIVNIAARTLGVKRVNDSQLGVIDY